MGVDIGNRGDSAGGDAVSPTPTASDEMKVEPGHDSSVATPFKVGQARLTRGDRVGLVVAALMMAAMFVVPLSLVRSHTAEGRDELNDRFVARAERGASVVGGFVADLSDQMSERAARDLVGASDPTKAFEQTVDAFSFDAALELDDDGRVVHVWPQNEDLIGTIVGPDDVHLATALTGQVGVANVVASSASAASAVAIAVPFDTSQGRHVLSGEFAATDSELANYFNAAAPTGDGHAYLVDSSNNIIVASTRATEGSDLRPAQLAEIGEGLTTTTVDGTDSTAFRASIDGTPWDVITITSSAVVYDPIQAPIWKRGLWLAVSTVTCVGGFMLLVRLARARAKAVASSTAHSNQEMMLRAVIENDQSVIHVKDLDGKYLLANPAFLEAFGLREAELLGKTDFYLDPELAPIWQANDIRARDGLCEVEEQLNGPDGVMTYESRKFPLRDSNGSVYATCGVSLEVTERRRSVEATEHARDAAMTAAAAQRDFTAAASHELRTPTTSIIGYVEELLANDNQNEEDGEFLLIVHRNAQRLSRLIDDLLIIGQADGPEPLTGQEPTDICDLVSNVISTSNSAAHSRAVNVTLSCAPGLPPVLVDPLRIEQALTNLVSNAVKFTPPGGDVTITIGVDAHNPALVQVAIADTGMGIEAGELNRIFERFFRSRTALDHGVKGTGLGLPIAKAMIEAHHGQITVASTIGKGTTFTVSLPTHAP